MKILIIFSFLFPYVIFCQDSNNFFYEEIAKRDGFIIKIESYDSKTSIYYRVRCGPYSAPFEEKVYIPLTQEEKSYLRKLKKESDDLVFGECTNNKEITVKSNFYFEDEKLIPRCLETQLQREQFIKLRMELRLILESKAEYKKVFYWEFIKK